MRKILNWIEKHEALLLILSLVVLMRLPGLFEPNRYADEDIYLTIGQGLRRGLVLYKDIYDNKTPLIYLLAALAGNITWFRFVLMIWNVINVFFIWKLAKKIIQGRWGVILSTLLFGLFTTLPLLEGEIANGEVFMILPTTLAIYLLLGGGHTRGAPNTCHLGCGGEGRFFWSGVFWGLAFLFKTPPLVEMAGVLFFLTIYTAVSVRDFLSRLFDGKIWLLLFGFSLPILLSFFYFWGVGGISEYINSVYVQTLPYLFSWGGSREMGLFSGGLITRGLMFLFTLIIIVSAKKKLGDRFGLMTIWFSAALFGALLSGRPYPHYLLQIVGPGAILLGICVVERSVEKRLLTLALFLILLVGVVRYDFWYYKSLAYYQNYLEYLFGNKSKEEYFRYWGEGVLRNQKAAAYIREVTGKNDKIFVWGTEPALYVLANRLPATKYTAAYHIADLEAKEEVWPELVRQKPKVVVVVNNQKGFSALAGLLVTDYALARQYTDLKVYLRLL